MKNIRIRNFLLYLSLFLTSGSISNSILAETVKDVSDDWNMNYFDGRIVPNGGAAGHYKVDDGNGNSIGGRNANPDIHEDTIASEINDFDSGKGQKQNLDDVGNNYGSGKRESEAEKAAREKAERERIAKDDKTFREMERRQRDLERQAASRSVVDQAKIKRDRELIEAARKAREQKRLLDQKLAKQANDEQIWKNLLRISKGQEEQREFERENARLAKQIGELSALAAKVAQAGATLGATKTSGAAPSTSGISTSENAPSIIQQSKNQGELSDITLDKAALKEELKLELAEEKKLAELKEPKGEAKRLRDYSLKKALQARLAAEAKAKGLSGMGGANGEGKDSSSTVSKAEAPAAQVTEEFLGAQSTGGGFGSGGSSGSKFSLTGSETEAEVKRMVDEVSRSTASAEDDRQAGIMEVDSVSLFERVTAQINTCVKKRRVVSLYSNSK